MLKFTDYSKIHVMATLDGVEVVRNKKKSGISMVGCILVLCVIILITIFIALSYIGYEIMDMGKIGYNMPVEWDISFLETYKSIDSKAFFHKHQIAESLECAPLFGNDSQTYIQNLIVPYKNTTYMKNRIKYKDEELLKIDCDSIKKRSYFPTKPRTKFEAEYPLAFVRIVYTDYLFIEMELAASYAPQNYYCYTIDKKAPQIFHDRMENLAKCFPNVIFTDTEYRVDSSGHNMWPAFVECLMHLQPFQWKYVMLLQNHDIQSKTNFELVQIFKWLNGANDVQVGNLPGGRVDMRKNWTFEGLGMFKNATRNKIGANGYPPRINWAKGYVESSLSREMVDFMLNDLNITNFMNQLESKRFGIDEVMIPTLQATDALGAPGGFTHECLNKKVPTYHITRMSVWYDRKQCPTGYFRHAICIFGIEDLDRMTKIPRLFINKFMPTFDFGAVTCWYEHLFNRTYLEAPTAKKLDKSSYVNLPHVRFHNEKLTMKENFDPKKFNC